MRTARYFRRLGREIGDAEATHGPDSEKARKKRKQFRHEVDRAVSVASDIDGVAEAIKDVRREFSL